MEAFGCKRSSRIAIRSLFLICCCVATLRTASSAPVRQLKAVSTAAPPPEIGTALQVDTGNLFSAFTDSEGGFWSADFNFIGGSTEGTRDAVANATGGVDPMYASNRVGPSFLYSFGPINRLMPNATYNVTLFFAELYWSRAGQRLFNISANNETRLTNFDIYKTAGGKGTAANVTIPVTLGPLAQLVLQFDSVKDQASLAGISVAGLLAPTFKLQSFLQNDTETAADLYGPALVRVDTGSINQSYTDPTGTVWEADRLYNGGDIEVFNAVVANASEGSGRLYTSNRVGGSFSYSFSAADGLEANQTYTVVLHAADLYWNKPRQRIFSVAANGEPVLQAYDIIAAAGGPQSATQAIFNVTATPEATILLQWTSIKDQAIVGAIEVYALPGAPDLAAPFLAPGAAPDAAPPPQTPSLPLQLYAPVTAPAYAPAYGSTFLQAYGSSGVALAPVAYGLVPRPSAYSGAPISAPTPAYLPAGAPLVAYSARAPSPIFVPPPSYSPPSYGSRPPAYGYSGGAY